MNGYTPQEAVVVLLAFNSLPDCLDSETGLEYYSDDTVEDRFWDDDTLEQLFY